MISIPYYGYYGNKSRGMRKKGWNRQRGLGVYRLGCFPEGVEKELGQAYTKDLEIKGVPGLNFQHRCQMLTGCCPNPISTTKGFSLKVGL